VPAIGTAAEPVGDGRSRPVLVRQGRDNEVAPLPAGTSGSAGLALLAMASVQSGAAVSTWMFDAAGPIGTAFLRLVWASLVLLVAVRPRVRGAGRRGLLNVAALGAMSAMMTICYFLAVVRVPLGVASSLEFLGPLTVAVWGLRGRGGALLWPVLAVAGVLMIVRPWDGGVAAHRRADRYGRRGVPGRLCGVPPGGPPGI
jgi:threonine/homoserine efflux transporter RhtA